MVSVEFCVDGSGKTRDVDVEEALRLLNDDRALVWLDVARSGDELSKLGQQLGFHKLAIEDATGEHERAKANIYKDQLFVLFYDLSMHDNRIRASPVAIFVGKNYVVTATDVAADELREVARRWHEFSEQIADRSPGALTYALLDALVDGYFPILDDIGDRLEALETGLVEHSIKNPQTLIHEMRLDMLRMRRVVGPEREAINTLLRRDAPVFGDPVTVYMQDVYDHLLRVVDWLETYQDVLSNLSDLQISVASHRLNQTMRTMTAWSIIFMATTLIAGIYGMNFHWMPELSWRYGYPGALLAMLCLGVVMFIYFRKNQWL